MEISLELEQAYIKDRLTEMINYDVKAGTPTVFLSGLAILNILSNLRGKFLFDFIDEYMPPDYRGKGQLLGTALRSMLDYYSLQTADTYRPTRLSLTHQNDKHLQEVTKESPAGPVKVTQLAAEPFIKDILFASEKLFEEAKQDKVLAAKIYVLTNTYKPIGYGL